MEYIRPEMVIGPGEKQLNEAFLEAEKNPTKMKIDIDEKEVIFYIDSIINSKKEKNVNN